MTDTATDEHLTGRILRTLHLAEERGYNLTLEQLSQKLLGGRLPPMELADILKTLEGIESDGVFFATTGHLYSEKCRQRKTTNERLQPLYTDIATRFITQYQEICPWVQCIMISGSMASEGLSDGDDIDFDIVVPDGLKYTSYLLALLLSVNYSLRYGKRFWRRHVICISVVWETRQVFPFQRTDTQLAFELLNARIVYKKEFFDYLLTRNPWLLTYFPQLSPQPATGILTSPLSRHSLIRRAVEVFSKTTLYVMYKIGLVTIFQDLDVRHRMMVKHPYALFDIPESR